MCAASQRSSGALSLSDSDSDVLDATIGSHSVSGGVSNGRSRHANLPDDSGDCWEGPWVLAPPHHPGPPPEALPPPTPWVLPPSRPPVAASSGTVADEAGAEGPDAAAVAAAAVNGGMDAQGAPKPNGVGHAAGPEGDEPGRPARADATLEQMEDVAAHVPPLLAAPAAPGLGLCAAPLVVVSADAGNARAAVSPHQFHPHDA